MKIETSQGKPIKTGTQKVEILKYIWKSGKDGRRYTDIVKFIVEDIKGMRYDQDQRGYYATNLLYPGPGSLFGLREGQMPPILHGYCEKNEKGRWMLTDKKLKRHFANVTPIHDAASKYLNFRI